MNFAPSRNMIRWAAVADPMIAPYTKLTSVYPSDDESRNEVGKCVECGTDVVYDPKTSIYPIQSVACCQDHAHNIKTLSPTIKVEPTVIRASIIPDGEQEEAPAVEVATPVAPKDDNPETCSVCSGPRKGRGYTHKDGCSESTAAKLAAKAAASTSSGAGPTCPKCNGPKRGRGYAHADGCSESTAAKLAAAKIA